MHSRMFSAGWCQGGKNSIKSAGGGKLQILGRVQLGMYYYDQDTIQDTILVLRWFLISLVLLLWEPKVWISVKDDHGFEGNGKIFVEQIAVTSVKNIRNFDGKWKHFSQQRQQPITGLNCPFAALASSIMSSLSYLTPIFKPRPLLKIFAAPTLALDRPIFFSIRCRFCSKICSSDIL